MRRTERSAAQRQRSGRLGRRDVSSAGAAAEVEARAADPTTAPAAPCTESRSRVRPPPQLNWSERERFRTMWAAHVALSHRPEPPLASTCPASRPARVTPPSGPRPCIRMHAREPVHQAHEPIQPRAYPCCALARCADRVGQGGSFACSRKMGTTLVFFLDGCYLPPVRASSHRPWHHAPPTPDRADLAFRFVRMAARASPPLAVAA